MTVGTTDATGAAPGPSDPVSPALLPGTATVGPDGHRAVGHEAKTAKGRLARALLDGGLAAADSFAHDGWRSSRDGDVVTVTAPGG